MVRKLDTKMECVEISVLGNKKAECLDFEAGRKLNLKINELCDAVNDIQKEREAERFEIQEWIGLFEEVRKSVNVHEKQIDELQMKLEPHKCETRSENVQPDAESRSENVQELALVRKALGIAVDALKVYANQENWDFEHFYSLDTYDIAADALEQITALEQKE